MFLAKANEQWNTYRKPDEKVPEVEEFDKIFENEIEEKILKVKNSYDTMIYRDVIKLALHELVSHRDHYLLNCDTKKPRCDLISRYIFLQLIMLYPICPHFCETAYIDYYLPIV